MKIILGFIALVVIAAAIGGFGGSDDESSAASAVDDSPLVAEGTDYSDDASDDADRGVELTTEGSAILDRIVAWSTAGESDPAGACASLSTAESDIAEVREIVIELGTLDSVDAGDLTELQKSQAQLEVYIEKVGGLCAEAGF